MGKADREPLPGDLTQLLIKWSGGDKEALGELVPRVQAELRQLARAYLRRHRPNQSMQTGSLINEAFLRLINQDQIQWQNRAHFFGIAARTMRNILVDELRKKRAGKRGGGAAKITFDDQIGVPNQKKNVDLIALDDALEALAKKDPELSQLVELRFFGGLTIKETAEVLGKSPTTVKQGWTTAKFWLSREISRR